MTDYQQFFRQIVTPQSDSRKGQNGRLLVIGGSRLFHAAPYWTAAVASRIVDLVHFATPASENDELMRVRAKEKFWEGIVVAWSDVGKYIEEDEAIVIGPGMPRDEGLMSEEQKTAGIVNELVARYPEHKWVIDGGALQEIDVKLIKRGMVITPNLRELAILYDKTSTKTVQELARKLGGVTILSKGVVNIVTDGRQSVEIEGGNAGLTKGGTGDVLAGIVGGLVTKSPLLPSCVVASYVLKRAAEQIARQHGVYFGPNEIIEKVTSELAKVIKS